MLCAAYGWWEAGWVRLRVLELPVDRLPQELDGLRVAHLSDLHLGVPSRGVRAVERAADWVAARRPDLVCITGDLLSRPRGEKRLRSLLARLGHPYVVLGNHDLALSRDPFSRAVELDALQHGTLLDDESVVVDGIELAGVSPRSWLDKRSSGFGEPGARLSILLCHFPSALDRVPEGRWDLILAGHLHAGQINVPYGVKRRLMLAHPQARFSHGVYSRGTTTMHVSPGLGTTFIPFRFFARPEATELVLRCGRDERA